MLRKKIGPDLVIGPEVLSSEPVSKVASGNHGNVTRHAAVPRPISRYARSSMRPGNTIACISCSRWHQPTQRKRRRFHWFRRRTGPRRESGRSPPNILRASFFAKGHRSNASTSSQYCLSFFVWYQAYLGQFLLHPLIENAPWLLLKNEKVSDAR